MSEKAVHFDTISGRKRIPLSCSQCKRRKVKCDRKMPCSSCVKHKSEGQCGYIEDQVMTQETAGTLMVFKQASKSDRAGEDSHRKRPKVHTLPAPYQYQHQFQEQHPAQNLGVQGHFTRDVNMGQGIYQEQHQEQMSRQDHQNYSQNYRHPVSSYPPANGYYNGSLESDAGKNKMNGPESGSEIYTRFEASIPGNGYPTQGSEAAVAQDQITEDERSEMDKPFDVYTGYTSMYREGGKNVHHGPFSWFSYIQKDKVLKALWVVSSTQNHRDAFQKVPQGKGSEAIRQNERGSAIESSTARDQISPNSWQNLKANLNKKTLALGLTVFEGTMDQGLDIIEKLKLLLPNKRATNLLIKRFFQVVYPYMCVIDETYFRGELAEILGPETKSEERYDHINIRKKKDFATMGTLLIILRVSYLSTFSNIRAENEDIVNSPYSLSDDISSDGSTYGESFGLDLPSQKRKLLFESKYILTHPISIDVMEYVQVCLDQISGASRSSLSVLQCLVMKRIYSDVAPEETDSADGYDASALNSTCIHIGYRLGIHRDLESQRMSNLSAAEIRYANLCRKIWFYVKLMDLKLAWHFGFPIMVDHNYSNLKGPYLTTGASNINNEELETKVCAVLTWSGSFYRNFAEMIKRCLSLQDPLKVSELLQLMDMFEEKISEDVGVLSDYTSSGVRSQSFSENFRQKSNTKLSFNTGSPGVKIELGGAEMSKEKMGESSEYPFVKVLKLKVYLNMKQFSMSIFYHLFLNFEKSGRSDLSFDYLSRIVTFFCEEFVPEILSLLMSTRSNFDSASTIPGLILNNSVIALIHKCDQIFFGIIGRSRFKLLKLKASPDHNNLLRTSESYRHRFGSLCSLTNNLSDIVKFNISCLARLNHRYYYAWRLSRTHTYVLSKTTTEDFNEKLMELDFPFIELCQDQIDDILKSSRECLAKIGSAFDQPYKDKQNVEQKVEQYVSSEAGMVNGYAGGNGDSMGVMDGSSEAARPDQYENVPELYDFDDYVPAMGMFAVEQFPEADLIWKQIGDMKEDNRREVVGEAPNDISDKFFPLSPQQDIIPPFDMNGAFEGFTNMYV